MMMPGAQNAARAPHIPVLLGQILQKVAPVQGVWLDGTFGAGGYARGLLQAGAARVIGVDRDPAALAMAAAMQAEFGPRLTLLGGKFSQLDLLADVPLDGVVLDLGVSSMQIDQAERGFSFQKDGPLDMRMSQSGPSASDIVAHHSESALADILFHFGEERAARRIARAIVEARAQAPITRTLQLAEIIAKCLPRPKPGQSHPATRAFQALRIAVNGEFDQLVAGLCAAERALKPGGLLAVVTFHSLEDRVVKRFFQEASGDAPNANRYAPLASKTTARFELVTRKALGPDEDELQANPRARSAKLRVARRTDVPAANLSAQEVQAPVLPEASASKGRR